MLAACCLHVPSVTSFCQALTRGYVQGRVSTLEFALGSHRDFALPMWHDTASKDLTGRYPIADTGGHGS